MTKKKKNVMKKTSVTNLFLQWPNFKQIHKMWVQIKTKMRKNKTLLTENHTHLKNSKTSKVLVNLQRLRTLIPWKERVMKTMTITMTTSRMKAHPKIRCSPNGLRLSVKKISFLVSSETLFCTSMAKIL